MTLCEHYFKKAGVTPRRSLCEALGLCDSPLTFCSHRKVKVSWTSLLCKNHFIFFEFCSFVPCFFRIMLKFFIVFKETPHLVEIRLSGYQCTETLKGKRNANSSNNKLSYCGLKCHRASPVQPPCSWEQRVWLVREARAGNGVVLVMGRKLWFVGYLHCGDCSW